MDGEADAADRVISEDRHGAAGNAQTVDAADAEDQQRRQRKQQQRAAADDIDRQDEIAGAADRCQQKIEQPDQDGAAEHQVRVGQRRVERGVPRAHGAIERGPGGDHQHRRQEAQRHGQEDSVPGVVGRLVRPATAQRAGDRRDESAAHRPLRDRPDE